MSKQHTTPPMPRAATPGADPAHAPGKHHLERASGAAEIHTIDRRQQQQRMRGGGPAIRNRRTERGR